MIKRTNIPRVLDTSALVHDPRSIFSYEDDIYICLTVLEELDNLKERRDKAISVDARACIRILEDLVSEYDTAELEKGIPLFKDNDSKSGKLFIGIDTNMVMESALMHGIGSEADNRIINFAVQLKRKLGKEVKIVSRDINMRLKCKAVGIAAEDVYIDNSVTDIDLLYSGVQAFEGDFFAQLKDEHDFALMGDVYRVPKSLFNDQVQPNMYWYDEANHIGVVSEVEGDTVYTRLIKKTGEKIWGVSPKNPRQAVALDQLTSPDYDLNILLGPAGSGKTHLAVAAALSHVLEHKKYNKIIVVRSRDFMDDEPGFLPGDLKEKSMPLLAGVTDALALMHGDTENTRVTVEHIIERANIEFTSMAYFRGRSLPDGCILIIDEAQNMTHGQMKAMLSRASKGCRTILLGNLQQIDDKFITIHSSGLTSAVNTHRHYEGCSITIFDKVERSPLAEFTEKYFV